MVARPRLLLWAAGPREADLPSLDARDVHRRLFVAPFPTRQFSWLVIPSDLELLWCSSAVNKMLVTWSRYPVYAMPDATGRFDVSNATIVTGLKAWKLSLPADSNPGGM